MKEQQDQQDIRKRIVYKRAPYERWKIAGIGKHVSKKHKVLMYVTTISVFAYVFWRVGFTIPFQYGVLSIIMGLGLLFAELCSFTVTLNNFREATHYLDPELPVIPESWYPDVDIYVTTHNETPELLYKSLNACTFMEYPDKSKVHIWLCDDRNRPEMKALAEEFGVGYFGMEGNRHAKAGNMNNAYWQTSAPLVVTFDADMVPTSRFLMEMVPFFFLPQVEKQANGKWRILEQDEIDPEYNIGFVQSPQSFYNPDLFQYNLYSEQNIPNEQDFFFTEANVAKNYVNAAQYAGSNTMLSRKALNAVGGFATESITEDFLTGVMILESGYRNLAIPEQIAHGLSPDSIGSLMSQRIRWARGNVQLYKLLDIFSNRILTIWQKISLLSALCYWLSFVGRLVFLVGPVLSALFDVTLVDAPTWQIFLFWVPHYVLYYFATRAFSSYTKTTHWSDVVDTIMGPYIAMPLLLEIIGIKERKFVVTDKSKGEDVERWRTVLYVLPHGFLLIATIASIFMIVRHSLQINGIYNPIVLFWLIVSTKNLVFAIFFMLGRINFRSSERFYARLPVVVSCNNINYQGYTGDLSETGLGATFDAPLNCMADAIVDLGVNYEGYTAYMSCKIVSVKQLTGKAAGKWKYGFEIADISDENKRQYMQILFDRPHSFAKQFKPNASVFDDINNNLMVRTRRREFNLRKMPRLYVNLNFKTKEGYTGKLEDFNFEYARLDFDRELEPTETLTLDFGEVLKLVVMPTKVGKDETIMYRIVNSEELLSKPDFIDLVNIWTGFETMPEEDRPVGTGYISTPIVK